MKSLLKSIGLSVVLLLPIQYGFAAPVDAQNSNPATQKFREDLKAAILSQSLTVPQLQELQKSTEILQNFKSEQTPGAPVDLITPHNAVTRIRAVMATVKQPDRTTLEQDFRAVMASKKPPVSSTPPSAGEKLGKDVFSAVMHGNPTNEEVKQLQDSLNSLQEIKTSNAGKLQQLMTLKKAKEQIEQTMNAGSFRPQDRQTVLDDLNSLGPQGGGGLRGGRL